MLLRIAIDLRYANAIKAGEPDLPDRAGSYSDDEHEGLAVVQA